MRAIFVSYRRSDAEGQAGRLYDDLIQHFGEDAVFMDVAALAAGRDFRRAIDEQVASCGVLLSVIGKNWLTSTDEAGARRLDDPMDFVRLETASALKRDIPVIPVLVQGARMPRVDELPDNLKELPFRNGVELTHARWDSDLELLIKALRPLVQPTPVPTLDSQKAPAASDSSNPNRHVRRIGLAVCAGVLLAALSGYVWYQSSFKESPVGPATSAEPGRVAEADKQRPTTLPEDRPSPTSSVEKPSSFSDWEGAWNLRYEFAGQWNDQPLHLKATQSGITGEYGVGTLEGRFKEGDFSTVNGTITNTTNTGTTCPSGKQEGSFSLTLAKDGKSMAGWWDVCSKGHKWAWEADRH